MLTGLLFQGIAVAGCVSPGLAGESAPITAPIGGVQSPYTELILERIRSWPPKDLPTLPAPKDAPLRINCLQTPGNDLYMGVEQWMEVHAPISAVEAVMDDFDHYAEIFPGYEEVKITSKQENLWLTSWEQRIPVFFIPNIKYEIAYLLEKSNPDRRIYRYQLKKPSQLKASDGFVILERKGPNTTHYYELDFFDADWGPVKLLGADRLWRDTVEGLYLSDMAVKLRAEHPDWSYDKVREESRKSLNSQWIDERVRERKPLVK